MGITRPEQTMGRGGIKLPDIPREDPGRDELLRKNDVIRVLRNLLTANDRSIDTSCPEGQPREYNHELVVPADAQKPLVVIRGSYKATSEEERTEEMNQRCGRPYDVRPDSDQRINYGTESYGILVPPDEIGPFRLVLAATQADLRGTFPVGRLSDTITVIYEGRTLHPWGFDDTPPPQPAGISDLQTKFHIERTAQSAAVSRLLERTVELLT